MSHNLAIDNLALNHKSVNTLLSRASLTYPQSSSSIVRYKGRYDRLRLRKCSGRSAPGG